MWAGGLLDEASPRDFVKGAGRGRGGVRPDRGSARDVYKRQWVGGCGGTGRRPGGNVRGASRGEGHTVAVVEVRVLTFSQSGILSDIQPIGHP